ncbi:MAG: site-2 protease family protein [Anaerolineales bacterium]
MLGLTPADLIARIVVLVVAFTVHEFAHAFVADRFGDDTPRRQGRLTLNPLVHLDPLGSLLLVLAGFGWARPVEINPDALGRRSPAAPMLVALAGPASNLLLAGLAALPIRFGLVDLATFQTGNDILPSIPYLLTVFILLNLVLMLFNLIPIFPLDGEKVLHFFLPPSGKAFMENIRPYGSLILLAVIFLLPSAGIDVLNRVIFEPAFSIFVLLVG